MDARDVLFVGLGVVLLVYCAAIVRGGFAVPTLFQGAVGFVTAFFDTLGIGSFATTTTVYKLRSMVPVKLIPGTLNVGHALATIAQAFVYTRIVPVESKTLVLMIVAASVGSWRGAGVVVRWLVVVVVVYTSLNMCLTARSDSDIAELQEGRMAELEANR